LSTPIFKFFIRIPNNSFYSANRSAAFNLFGTIPGSAVMMLFSPCALSLPSFRSFCLLAIVVFLKFLWFFPFKERTKITFYLPVKPLFNGTVKINVLAFPRRLGKLSALAD